MVRITKRGDFPPLIFSLPTVMRSRMIWDSAKLVILVAWRKVTYFEVGGMWSPRIVHYFLFTSDW